MTDSFSYDPYGDTDANNVPDGGEGQDTTAGDGLPGYPLRGSPDWRAGVPGVTSNLLGLSRTADLGVQATGGETTATPSAGHIDWPFIHGSESHQLSVYVPVDNSQHVVGHSGPTVGYGFDMGQHSAADLRSLGLSPRVIDMLTPYLGRQGDPALAYVKSHPLEMAAPDVGSIDQAMQARTSKEIAAKFDADSQIGAFGDLPSNTQTAIADLYHQYGIGNPAHSTPGYWRQITNGDWQGAYDNLRTFHDKYPTRRAREAALLKQDMDAGILPGNFAAARGP